MINKKSSINSERLWNRLMHMAEIGATSAGGCNRQALTDEDAADLPVTGWYRRKQRE
ncbi:MAG: hypothetical protein V7746_25665 [Halioglobus sp.]